MSFRRTVTAILLCGACALAGDVAWANGSVHHNTTNNVTNEGDVTNEGGQGGQGGAGGQGGNSASNASSAQSQSMSYSGYDSSISQALSGCQAGAAGIGGGYGGSIGAESRVCQLLRLAAAHQGLGMHYEAAVLVRQAARELNGGAEVEAEAPFLVKVSRTLRRELVQPLFGWLPFIGHAA